MRHKIYITRARRGLGAVSARALIQRAASAALSAENITVPCEVSVLLTDDEGICKLNRDFRKKDGPTDVLSFPANEMTAGRFEPEIMERNPKTGRVRLGDMAISLERVRAQGEELGHGEKRELQYLTVHSVLHLLGYDHVDEAEGKIKMRGREKKIMKALGGAESDEEL